MVVYDRARVEPTVESFQDAADFALEAEVDGFVSVGGGSSIDTAKVANLITKHPAAVIDYVNPPVGGGGEAARPDVSCIGGIRRALKAPARDARALAAPRAG